MCKFSRGGFDIRVCFYTESLFSFLMEVAVDDGSAVIECHHHHRRPPPPPPGRDPPPHVPLKPIASVGTAVVIIGKVVTKYGGRELNVNSIGVKLVLHYKRINNSIRQIFAPPPTMNQNIGEGFVSYTDRHTFTPIHL